MLFGNNRDAGAREGAGTALLRLRRDDRGITAPLLALSLAVLIGMAGLGAETGLWYTIKRVNQSAADAAALSGAFEVLAGQPYADMCGFAQRDAERNGFVFASYTCPGSTPGCTSPASGQMCANYPPVLGANIRDPNSFEVILAQDQSTLLSSLSLPSVTIGTRAVAVIHELDDACLLALDPHASDAILIKGNLNMPNCSIVADSDSSSAIDVQGSAIVTADTLRSHGGITKTGGTPTINLKYPAQSNAPVVVDPYAPGIAPGNCTTLCLTHTFLTTGMPNARPCITATGSCVVQSNSNLLNGNVTLSANTQIHVVGGPWTIQNQIVNLSPGTYWVTDGDVSLGAGGILECTLCDPATGAGVTIIFTISTGTTVGGFTMQANTNVGNPSTAPNFFNAPNSGTFKGLLFIQDSNGLPNGTMWNDPTFQGGPNTVLNGLVYTPRAGITFNGKVAAGGTGCLLVVADKLTLSGDSQLDPTGCEAAGVPPPDVQTVVLAE
jgi:hypothetical protein